MTLFSRSDLEQGIRLVVAELHRRGRPAHLRIVGGAAMALRYYDRESTQDIDVAVSVPDAELEEIATQIATSQGWNPDWLNTAAAKYIPFYGRKIEWVTIHDEDGIVVQVAPADAMLAMKLRANRPGRDDDDIKVLMAICGLSTVAALEELYEGFYPEDLLSVRAVKMIEAILAEGIGPVPPVPAAIGRPEVQVPRESTRTPEALDDQIAHERLGWD